MTAHKNNPSNHDSGLWRQLQERFDEKASADNQPLRTLLKNFADDLENHPYVQKKSVATGSGLLRRFAFGFSTAAAILIVVMLVFLSSPTPSWAQISEQFACVEFMAASIFYKEDGLADARHIELWMGRGGKVRVRVENQLIFGEKGRVLAAFDLKTQKQVEADQMAATILKMLGIEETFSMETILKGISRGKAVNQTPVLNPNAAISEDMVVFDMDTGEDNNPQWFRIWALKKSKLPVRIRMWDPRDASMVEMVLDYSRPQSEVFFDPKAFAAALTTIRTDQLNLAYLNLEDAGGRAYVPGVKDESKLMSIMTTTIDGEPFSLSHYADKDVLVYFWDRYTTSDRDFKFLKETAEKYADCDNLEIVTVALDKNAETVRQQIEKRKIDYPVAFEAGKGFDNSLARAIGVKRGAELWLVHNGQAMRLYCDSYYQQYVDLLCRGMNAENYMAVSGIAKFTETTKSQMQDLCGQPHEKRTESDTELWLYKFITADKLSRMSVSIRFNSEDKYTGFASSGRLINPSRIALTISEKLWHEKVVAKIGKENMPDADSDSHIEIWIHRQEGGGAPCFGGGSPRTEIVPEKAYSRELRPGTYRPEVVLIANKKYKRIQQIELPGEITIGDNESVSVRLEPDGPVIERSEYRPEPAESQKDASDYLLKKPDYKQMLKDAYANKDTYDDPKYLPWQLHLKEVAKRYENRPLPETMELFEKGTDESYKLIMFPKNLPGHEGYSVKSIESDLKTGYGCQTLGAGLLRWPDDVPTVQMNHDLVYRDDVKAENHYPFLLDQMGYRLETQTVPRQVFVAHYDGRQLPDPESVSAPNPVGWGYTSLKGLLDMITIHLDGKTSDRRGYGPLFIDETGLPSGTETLDEIKKNAITMEMPQARTLEDFESLRPWYKENFGITFTEETRPVEIYVVRKK